MGPILAIAAKEIRLLFRDKVGAFFIFVFPAAIGIFAGFIFSGGGGPSGIGVIVVDLDQSDSSKALVETISQGDTFRITPLDDWDAALDNVRKGNRSAALRINEGFADDLLDFNPNNQAVIDLAIDPSKSFQRGIIEGLVTQAAFRQLTTSFTNPDMARGMLTRARDSVAQADDLSPLQRSAFTLFFDGVESLADSVMTTGDAAEPDAPEAASADAAAADTGFEFNPIQINPTDVSTRSNMPKTSNAFTWTFSQSAAWALMGCVAGFTASLVLERTRGTMTRLRLAPIGVGRLLAGKALACFLSAVFVQVGLIALSYFVFGVRPQSFALLGMAVVVGSLGFVGIAMLLSVIGKTEQAAMGISQATLIILALGGGAGVPLFIMPKSIQTIASVSPFKWLILAHDGAVWRGYTLADMLMPLGILLAIGIVCFTAGAILFHRQWSRA